ncbi:hypothetical protein ACTQ4E_16270 [Lawsonibacter sp. LCP25S3_G6]|uniref:hypothetical protein n=1 Tax=unclassified Lawsonibacter TaxID=2617946 RepID=UPI003F9A9623
MTLGFPEKSADACLSTGRHLLEADKSFPEDSGKWRYHYPEFDKPQNYVKVPPQNLFCSWDSLAIEAAVCCTKS